MHVELEGEKHEILLSNHLVTIAVDRWRAQLSTILKNSFRKKYKI
jgi:hypothetical protein